MAETPITLTAQSFEAAKNRDFEALQTIWRNEALKRGVENALAWAGAHSMGRLALENYAGDEITDVRLLTDVAGIELDGPVGIGAGWDKTARTIKAWDILGARFVVPGAVNYDGQPGNPMPRLRSFDQRVGDHGKKVTLNSMGFNSHGIDRFVANVEKQRELGLRIPIIAQATLTKEFYEDSNKSKIPKMLAKTVARLVSVADGISLGLSSPNTLGMRDAQAIDTLRSILYEVRAAMPDNMPLEYKGDGDGGEERMDMYCQLAIERLVNIYSFINTTAKREIKAKYGAEELPGGLAGADPDYQQMAVDTVRYVYEEVGDKVDIIGLGGVNSGRQAMKLMKVGASATAVVSGVLDLGLKAVKKIETGIIDELDRDHPGKALADVIGIETKRGVKAKKAA